VGVSVLVGVNVTVFVREGVGVRDGVGVREGVGVRVAVGVTGVFVEVGVGDGGELIVPPPKLSKTVLLALILNKPI
jgi:hypothetical protein